MIFHSVVRRNGKIFDIVCSFLFLFFFFFSFFIIYHWVWSFWRGSVICFYIQIPDNYASNILRWIQIGAYITTPLTQHTLSWLLWFSFVSVNAQYSVRSQFASISRSRHCCQNGWVLQFETVGVSAFDRPVLLFKRFLILTDEKTCLSFWDGKP